MEASMLRWLNGTRLGSAVVPDVWRMNAGAFESGSSRGVERPTLGAANVKPGEKFASMIGTARRSATARAVERPPRSTTALGHRMAKQRATSVSVSFGSIGTAAAEHVIATIARA